MGLYEDLIREQQQREQNQLLLDREREKIEANRQFGLMEFVGQALWGGASALTMGGLDLRDTYMQANEPGYETWEDWISLGGPSEWEDLTNWGKAGYTVGTALGMLPTFIVGGAGAKGMVKGGAKLAGNVGVRSLKKQASKELMEKAGKIASQHGDEVLETIGKKADTIIDDVYKLAGEGSVAQDIGKKIGSEWYQQIAAADIAKSIIKTLPMDQKVANELATEAFEIFTRNNPADAANMMRAMVRRIPGLDNRAGKIVGAMAYESMIGLNMGLLRAGASNAQRWKSGYEGLDQYGEKPEGSYWLDTMHHGLNEGAWFSVIGPVKFIKGGTQKQLWKKAKDTFTGMYRAMRNAGGLGHKELQHTLTAMDILQGGTLNARMGDKWAKKGAMWWKDAVEGEGTKEMKNFLNEARMTFLRRAPIELTKEFGKEIAQSIPRMGMGVLAMNAHGLFEYYKNGGDGLPFNALGRDPAEIIGNIMTAAFFTRRPHSFHDNNPIPFMESGKIESYFGGKASELRKTTGTLQTMIKNYKGSRLEHLERITANYAPPTPSGSERAKNITNHSISSSREMNELREILTPFIAKEGEIRQMGKGRFFTIEDAVNDYIAKNYAEKGQEGKRDQLIEQMFIAKKIIDLHDNHTFEKLDMKSVTPEQAVEIVQKISSIEFGEKPLQYETILDRVPDWIMDSISQNTVEPMGISKRFIKSMYDMLGVQYQDKDGILTLPRIHDPKEFHFNDALLLEAFSTVYKNGKNSGWIREVEHTADPVKPNAEQLIAANKIWNNSINELMQYTYGEGWDTKGIERDISIMQNDAWYHTYRNIADIQQVNDARAILTGDSKHNMDITESKRLTQRITNKLFAIENPGVEYATEAGDAKTLVERANLDKFVKRLHTGVRNLNPQISNKTREPLTEPQAVELKNKVEQLVGDTFSREEAFRFFERQSFEKSVQKLGLSDMRVGFDTKAALFELYNNPDINFGESGQLVFPDFKNVKETLKAAVRANELSKEAAKEYIKFYGDLTQATTEAGVGLIKFSGQVNQAEAGQWASALKMAKIKALSSIGGLITKEGSITANYAFQAVKSLDLKRKLLAQGILEMTDKKGLKTQEDILNLYDRSKIVIQNLGAQIKEAIDSNDTITLHAWSNKMRTARDLIQQIEFAKEDIRSDYLQQLIDLKNDALSKMRRTAWSQTTIDDLVTQKLRDIAGDIPGKDVTDSTLRTTLAQFSLRYGVNALELNDIFSPATEARVNADIVKALGKQFLTDYYDDLGGIQNVDLRTKVENIISNLDRQSGQIEMNGEAFHKFVYEPLKARIMIDRNIAELAGEKLKIDFETVESDLYSVAASFFSTRPVRHLQIDLAQGRLWQSTKPLGYTPDRGITGLINTLEGMGEGQRHLYILNNDVWMPDGNVKNLVVNRDRQFVDLELKTKDFQIEDLQGKSDFYATGSRDKIIDVDRSEPVLSKEYKIINLDEKTSVLVRMDSGIKRNIAAAFDNGTGNNDGGVLHKKLEAIMASEGRTINSSPRLVKFIESIQDASRMDHALAADAVRMARLILDMPSFVEKSIDQYGKLNVDSAEFKDRWKRLGMTHSKNGYIGTPQNLEKTATLYKNSESPFFKDVYKAVKDWVEPKKGKYKKVKVLSIDDNASYTDKNLVNIFSSIERAKVQINRRLDAGEIDSYTSDYMLRRYEEISKSITDGEMFVSKDVLLASMAMRGVTREMVDYDTRTGKIVGFKSGAIKPSITHVDLKWEDISKPNYGEVTEWYGKTAFKYAPELDGILKMHKVDAITFRSANKINEHKASATSPWDVDAEGKSTRYAIPSGIDKGNADIINSNITDFLGKGEINLEITPGSITEIPFSSINLRSISREHPPLVGNNTAVHMRDNNGLAEWIGLERKIDGLSYGFQGQIKDIFLRTELANKVFGAASESGDNTAVRTGIESVLSRNGLLTDPWMQKRLEENLINYYINNGNIGAGIVPDGSIDVMSADLGNLAVPVRGKFNINQKDISAVQFFGEFQMSHYGGQKRFELYGEGRGNVQSAIIQKIKYATKAQSIDYNGNLAKVSDTKLDYRTADSFLTTSSTGEQYLIVEGMAINKNGKLLDLDNIEANKPIFRRRMVEMELKNKEVYNLAVEQQKNFLDQARGNNAGTMSEYAAQAYRWSKESGKEIGIGILNSRQPRNMVGDIVINKAKVFEKDNGDLVTTVDKRSGNISRMNHVDAISPQDADFDMDKSFAYTAAHGNFWMEAGRLAGYDLTRGNKITIAEDFATMFESAIPEMIRSTDITPEEAIAQGNMHRGMFVKMHQTATYLANIFREDADVMHFDGRRLGIGKGEIFTVRLKDQASYISTVDNIAKWSSRYIDLYKNALAQKEIDKARDIQYNILFGKDGIFEIVNRREGGIANEFDLASNSASEVREAIIKRLVLPVNRYLSLNRGVTTDSFGSERKARLSNYSDAYLRLLNSIDSERSYAGVKSWEDSMDMRPGLRAAQSYFANSKAPFDISMKSMHQIYDQIYSIKAGERGPKALDPVNDILSYIEEGFMGDAMEWGSLKSAERQVKLNETYRLALADFVKDQQKALILSDMAGKLKSLELQIEDAERFGKTEQLLDRKSYQDLIARRNRLVEAKTLLESALTTQWGDPLEIGMEKKWNPGYKEKKFINKGFKPMVIVDGFTKQVKEVVLPGKSNFEKIGKRDIIIENGRHFEITDPLEQQGLRMIWERFGGLPGYTNENGRRHVISMELNEGIIMPAVNRIYALTAEARDNLINQNRHSQAEMARERLAIITEELSRNSDIVNAPSAEAADLYRWGIISRLLSPRTDNTAISLRKLVGSQGRRAVLDLKFIESKFAEPVYSLLTAIENGSYLSRGMDRATAKEFLDNINAQKKIGALASMNKFIDLDMLETRFFTEPADIQQGYLSSGMHLDKSIFKQLENRNQNIRRAAEIMVDYARGNRLLDGVTLYKASRELTKANIPINKQMVRTKHEQLEDGTGKTYGERIRSVSELDAAPMRKWGRNGSIEESVQKRNRELYECYLKGQ